MDHDPRAAAGPATAEPPAPSFLSWPPPGLERLQGDLWRVVRGLFAGGVVLVAPTLGVVVRDEPFYSVGPLQEAWWVLVITSLVGLALLWRAFTDLFRLAGRTARALDRGHGPYLVTLVAADRDRDAGFLLQGSRIFSVLSPATRRLVMRLRLTTVASLLAGGLWLPVAFVAAVLLGSRGLLSPRQVAMVPLLPCALLVALGGVTRFWERFLVSRARRDWHSRPWVADLDRDQIQSWNEALTEKSVPLPMGPVRGSGSLRVVMAVTVLLALFVTLPMIALMASSSVTPLMAMAAVPRFERSQARAAEVEPLRRYRVEIDPALTPETAGEILHVLLHAGHGLPAPPPELSPARSYDDTFLPEGNPDDDPSGIAPPFWPERLFQELGSLGPEGIAHLRAVGSHPALAELSTLATAGSMDVAAARWRTPFPQDLTAASFPIPRMSALREVGYAQIARAAVAALDGREADAERYLRELVSYGLLLGDHGPLLLDNLVGYVTASAGGDALESFYRSRAREAEAETLAWAREAARAAAARAQVGMTTSPLAALREMPDVVVDSSALRGLRWEFFVAINSVAPCLNLNRIVFGPDEGYSAWLEQARASLVRYPSEAPLFELMSQGYFGSVGGPGPRGLPDRLLGLAMGGSGAHGSCAALFRAMVALR